MAQPRPRLWSFVIFSGVFNLTIQHGSIFAFGASRHTAEGCEPWCLLFLTLQASPDNMTDMQNSSLSCL